jgi:GT2 family glycosyltransferase
MTNEHGMPHVAVVIVAYGGCDDTLQCIESLLRSDYTNLTIILVDNASPDNTREMVSTKFPPVKIIASKKNLGFAGGNNLGIKESARINAKYVFLLNNDAEIAPDAVRELISEAEKTENLGAMGPMIYYFSDKSLIWSAGGRINFRWSYLEHIGLRKTDKGQYNRIADVDYLTGCAMLIPLSRISDIGDLDESFWMYYEDADLCMRLKKKGYRIVFNPKGKVWHKISSSTGGNLSMRKLRYKFTSGWKFFCRHSLSPMWFISYPVSQFLIFIKAVRTS